MDEDAGREGATTTARDQGDGPAGPRGPARAPERPARPERFRAVPLFALVAVVFLALCVSPVAFNGGWFWLTLLLPVAAGWWVVRTATLVDGDALRVRTAWGSRRLPWDQVTTLRVAEQGRVRAVRADGGSELALPGVRVRDLSRVGDASGGRRRGAPPAEAEAAAERERELAATRMRLTRLREQEAGNGPGTPDTSGDGDAPEATDADATDTTDSPGTPDSDGGAEQRTEGTGSGA